jgi:hypothetical protein
MAAAFDKKMADNLGEAVEKELAGLAERMGLQVLYAGGSLSGSRFTMKLDFDFVGVDKEAEDFKLHADSMGLLVEDLGKEVVMGGRKFTIAGLKLAGKGSQSAPVVGTDLANGKRYLLKVGQVKMALGREVSEWEKNF